MRSQRTLLFASFAAAVSIATAQSPVYGQCGGQGWSGSTTCASGSSCVYSNPYYSQCLPGASGGGGSGGGGSGGGGSGSTTTSPGSPQSTGKSPLPFVGGVNMAGYDFTVTTDGSFTGTGYSPPTSQFSHFASQGANIFRIPFAWQLMTPTLGGTIDSNFFSKYDATVQTALSTGAYVIIDLHNYARWNGGIIAQGGPSNDQYTSLWTQLAKKYANNQKVIFGLMNEPHDLNVATWANTVQLVVNAIRSAGATSNILLLPGSSYTSAQTFPTEAGPYLLKVTDPGNTDTSKLIFDVHKYLDSDNSGTHSDCTTNNVGVMTTLVSWLKSNGRQALLSETGGGNTSSCETDVAQELAYIKQNSGSIVGFVMWAAGAFDTTYTLTLTPNADGSDQPLWTIAVKPNLP